VFHSATESARFLRPRHYGLSMVGWLVHAERSRAEWSLPYQSVNSGLVFRYRECGLVYGR